ncbi:primase-helicase family protein [Crocinitomix catalasitica]|uniref:primase-helicase family protein n=1 Tax=Crocinitomix catalasitica TaxID=184607 RepID=UPI000684A128|nr:primase-helicase family protein [Crocinitomix catalasitica]
MKLKDGLEKYVELYRNGFLFDTDSQIIYTNDIKKVIPNAYKDWEVEKIDFTRYALDRLKELGISDDQNSIELIGGVNLASNERVKQRVFFTNKFGDIEILQYNLQRQPYTYTTKNKESQSSANREKYHVQKRLHPLHENICVAKYDFSEAINAPFWHKSLIEAFEEEKEIETLIITEGQIKSFSASMAGISTAGITSINHFKEGNTGAIHAEFIEFIRQCKVQKLVILWDGDCRNISSKALVNGDDLTKRPNLFYKNAATIRGLVQDFFPAKKLKIYFATIKTNELNNEPKGIDDLLIEYKKKKKEIVKDFSTIGYKPGVFITWLDITTETGVKRLRKFFKLTTPHEFYSFHQDNIKDQDFIYYGTTYRVENGEPIKKIDANVKNYKRIGPDYYKLQKEPVPFGKKDDVRYESVLNPWTKTAILEDHGKEVIEHIERYEGFTNHASHTDYKGEIGGYWNLYYNVDHNEKPGEFPHIKKLLTHIFAEQYSMILDYICLLYRQPLQKLPVICLVSKEQKTGKSTFVYLMKLIFKQNMALISNSDLLGDFNSQWTSKLIVASEETMLEKKEAYEKIKAISTAKEIMRNEKNKTARSIPCMVHFIFCSNHEDDFIRIDDYDSRLWIRKVKSITETFKNFDENIENEIPYFVHFIQNREIEYKDIGERLYFNPKDFRTEAFNNVVANSEPNILKNLREDLIDLFDRTKTSEIKMSLSDLFNNFAITGNQKSYLKKSIENYWKLNAINSSYSFNKFNHNGELETIKKSSGRHYTFLRLNFIENEDKNNQKIVHQPKQTSILDY